MDTGALKPSLNLSTSLSAWNLDTSVSSTHIPRAGCSCMRARETAEHDGKPSQHPGSASPGPAGRTHTLLMLAAPAHCLAGRGLSPLTPGPVLHGQRLRPPLTRLPSAPPPARLLSPGRGAGKVPAQLRLPGLPGAGSTPAGTAVGGGPGDPRWDGTWHSTLLHPGETTCLPPARHSFLCSETRRSLHPPSLWTTATKPVTTPILCRGEGPVAIPLADFHFYCCKFTVLSSYIYILNIY